MNEELVEYARQVEECRNAQKQFFSKRDNFDECRELEKALDAVTDCILRPTLFSGQEQGQ